MSVQVADLVPIGPKENVRLELFAGAVLMRWTENGEAKLARWLPDENAWQMFRP